MSATCPHCEQLTIPLFRTTDLNRCISTEVFTYYRCPDSGLIFLDPIPEDLGAYYGADYYPIPESLEQLARDARAQGYKIDIARQFVTGGRLLEIGPAYGGFAFLAKEAGFEVDTIEMDSDCCRFLTDVVGVRAINSGDPLVALASLPHYDVVAMWHVVEHLPDPWPLLDALAGHLSPGGILILAAPNPQAFQFRLFRGRWTHVDAPRHVQLIPISLLVQHMAKRGMRPALITTRDRGTLGWNGFGWQHSLSNLFGHPLAKTLARQVGRVLTKALIPIERTGLRGSTYTLVFEK